MVKEARPVRVDLPAEMHARLRVVAAVKGVTMAAYAREVLERAIAEDYPKELDQSARGGRKGKKE
jgi:plasmid stability protein